MRQLLLLCALFLVVSTFLGCGALLPTEGIWQANSTVASNTCGDAFDTSDLEEDNAEFKISTADGIVKIIFDEDNNVSATCQASEGKWVCDSITISESKPADGATLVVAAVISFSTTGDGKFTGTQSITLTCKGDSCEQLLKTSKAKIPCEINVSLTGTLKEAK